MPDVPHPDELLVLRLLEGTLENDEAGALLRFLDVHPEATRNLARHIELDSDLREMSFTGTVQHVSYQPMSYEPDFDDLVKMEKNALSSPVYESLPVLVLDSQCVQTNDVTALAVRKKGKGSGKEKQPATFGSGAALTVLLFVLAVTGIYFEFRRVPGSRADFKPVARVEAAVDVVWPGNTDILRPGQQLEEERIRFEKGLLELTLRNNVRIALEGPVDFHLNSVSQTFCGHGKLSATVPPEAVGFEVVTPHLTVIDRGTEFSLDVDEHRAETHTIRGRIELARLPQNAKIQLGAGEALQFRTGSSPKRVPADPKTFLSREIVGHRVAASDSRQLQGWKERDTETRGDPSLLVYFDFEDVKSTVRNRSVSGRGTIGDGVSVGARATRGRWGGKGAIEFKGKNDSVDFFVPDGLKSLTLTTSVRIDTLNRPHHVLLASRGFGVGHLIWQISRDGSLQLMIQGKSDQSTRRFASPPVLSRKHWGAWYRLAVVLDAGKRSVVHYLDGAPVAEIPFTENLAIQIANATLGNAFWDGAVASDRSFDGRMEEFRLFNRALTPEEIGRYGLTEKRERFSEPRP